MTSAASLRDRTSISSNARATPNQKPYGKTASDLVGLVSRAEWTGVSLNLELQEVGLQPGARWVIAVGADAAAMARSIPIEKCLQDAIITHPSGGQRLMTPGFHEINGIAWSGHRKIRRVDIRRWRQELAGGASAAAGADSGADPLPLAAYRDGKPAVIQSTTPSRQASLQPVKRVYPSTLADHDHRFVAGLPVITAEALYRSIGISLRIAAWPFLSPNLLSPDALLPSSRSMWGSTSTGSA